MTKIVKNAFSETFFFIIRLQPALPEQKQYLFFTNLRDSINREGSTASTICNQTIKLDEFSVMLPHREKQLIGSNFLAGFVLDPLSRK